MSVRYAPAPPRPQLRAVAITREVLRRQSLAAQLVFLKKRVTIRSPLAADDTGEMVAPDDWLKDWKEKLADAKKAGAKNDVVDKELKAELAGYKAQLQELRNVLAKTKDQEKNALDESSTQKATLATELANEEARVVALQQELQTARNTARDESAKADARINKLEQESKRLGVENTELKKNVEQIKEDALRSQQEMGELQKIEDKDKEVIKTLQDESVEAKKEKEAQQLAVKQILQDYRTELDTALKSVESKEVLLKELQEHKFKLQEEIHRLNSLLGIEKGKGVRLSDRVSNDL